MYSAIANAVEQATEGERQYQALRSAAMAAGAEEPKRIKITREPAATPSRAPWWSLALAIFIGANL